MEQNTFLSSDGKNNVAYYIYDCPNPRAVVQLTHGMMDYIFRYKNLIEFLNKNGIVVCGNDDLGHGNTAKKEDYGFFAKKDGYKYVVQDIKQTTNIVKEKYKNLPYFLIGHSMGSFFARYYAYLYPNELNGLILLGTSGKIAGTGFGIFLMSILKFFKGEKAYSNMMDKLMLKAYFKYISEVKTGKEWVTSNKEILADYEKDPMCSFRFTVSAYKDMFKVLKFVNTKKWAKGINKNMPIFIASGSLDPVGNYGKSVCAVYSELEKQQVKNLTLKLYEGAYHELHNEQPNIIKEFNKDILAWIEKRI